MMSQLFKVSNTLPYEQVLQTSILPDLEKGRPNWDKPHTEIVVEYVKSILAIEAQNYNLDADVLVVAAYAHDWGYAELFEDNKPVQLDEVYSAKKRHMELGAKKLEKLLTDITFNFLTDTQKTRAVHLVEVHDTLDIISTSDERVLVEADTLAALDVTRVTPQFNKESNTRWMENVRNKRYPLFLTDYSKGQFERLFRLREEFYEKTN